MRGKTRILEREMEKEEKRKIAVEVEKLAENKRKRNIKQQISLA